MIKNYVEIKLDKPRKLLISFNSMCAFEEVTGKGFLSFADSMATQSATMSEIRCLLWACLRHEDETLTVERTGELMDLMSVPDVIKKLLEAVTVNMPDPEGDKIPLGASRPE